MPSTPLDAAQRFLEAASTGDPHAIYETLGTLDGPLAQENATARVLAKMASTCLRGFEFYLALAPQPLDEAEGDFTILRARVRAPGREAWVPLSIYCVRSTKSGGWWVLSLDGLAQVFPAPGSSRSTP